MRNELKHFNPFHDVLGRFASARGGADSAASSSDTPKKATYKKYSNDAKGRMKMLEDLGVANVEKNQYGDINTGIDYADTEAGLEIYITDDCGVKTSDIRKDLKKLIGKHDTFIDNVKKDAARMLVQENVGMDEDFFAKNGAKKGKRKREQLTKDHIDVYSIEYRAGMAFGSPIDSSVPRKNRREIEVMFSAYGPLKGGEPMLITYDPSTGQLYRDFTVWA